MKAFSASANASVNFRVLLLWKSGSQSFTHGDQTQKI